MRGKEILGHAAILGKLIHATKGIHGAEAIGTINDLLRHRMQRAGMGAREIAKGRRAFRNPWAFVKQLGGIQHVGNRGFCG